MWNNRGSADDSAGDGDDREKAIAKTAGFVVFSGIAMSIIKALNPFNNNHDLKNVNTESTQPQVLKQWQPQELPPPPPPPQPQPPSEPIVTVCNSILQIDLQSLTFIYLLVHFCFFFLFV